MILYINDRPMIHCVLGGSHAVRGGRTGCGVEKEWRKDGDRHLNKIGEAELKRPCSGTFSSHPRNLTNSEAV
jgi:hypothetical protein